METSNFSKFWNITVLCGLAGAFLSSWLAPKFIAWYFDPPVNIGVNCRAATEWSMSKLQYAQFTGLAVGAIMGLMAAIYFKRKKVTSTEKSPNS